MIDYKIAIKRVEIINFRKFKKLNIDFASTSLAVLSGRNATGKTSILEAINIALSERSSKFTDVKESDFYSEEPISIKIEFNNPFFFQFDDNNYKGLIPCYSFTKTIKRRDRKERGKSFSSEYDINIKYDINSFDPTDDEFNEIKKAEADVDAGQYIVRKFKIDNGAYNYSKRTHPNSFSVLPISEAEFKYTLGKVLFPLSFYFDNDRDRELLSQYNTSLSKIITEMNWRLKRELIKPANITKKDALFQTYEDIHDKFNDLDDHEKTLINPAIQILNKDFGIKIAEADAKIFAFNIFQPYTNALFGKITEKNQLIQVTDYGSGISMLLALSLSISFTEDAKVPVIILIDEPELHLHADLQKALFLFLKTANFQAILSTHSHLLIDKTDFSNNHLLEETENGETIQKQTTQLDVADLQFRLLGNSLDDLYIPEHILIVEGTNDSYLIKKCLVLLGFSNLSLQIIEAGGKDNIPNKSDNYEKVLRELLRTGNWYLNAIRKVLKILVDGDVETSKVNSWVSVYGFTTAQIQHLNPTEKLCMENYLPETLVKECVQEVEMRDGSILKDKTKKEIIDIILKDDKVREKDKETLCQQTTNRVSKTRFNRYIADHITVDILNSTEGAELKAVIDWSATW
jgi:predicted ATP-dependent endonuclease of OLD family